MQADVDVPSTGHSQEQDLETPPEVLTDKALNIAEAAAQESPSRVEKVKDQDAPAIPQKDKHSPHKVILRPEDSIGALDDLEDEMEKVGELIPAANKHSQSQSAQKKQGHSMAAREKNKNGMTAKTSKPTKQPVTNRTRPVSESKTAADIKKVANDYPTVAKVKVNTNPHSNDRKASNGSTEKAKQGSTTARYSVSSVNKAPFVPSKSTKPPTRASFELPGEAVARKLKEAREERMKREEEEKPSKAAFKARPVRLSQAPVIVRATAASRARISLAKGEAPAAISKKPESPLEPKAKSRPSTLSTTSTAKRLPALSVTKRSMPAPANTSARVKRDFSSNTHIIGNTSPGRPSTQTVVRRSVTPADAAQLRAKGKEVFNRGRVEQDERDRLRKEKEDAARKARAEAAERGRIASREWAEKQKAKKLAEKKGGTAGGLESEASV
ncbi:MAG: hypothetical protein Q9222_000427 [Ikaeria aurantiellina]